MNPIAEELNRVLQSANPHVYEMLSEVGRHLFFPKGILSQSAEAKEKAYRFNATIGMATERGATMFLPSVMDGLKGLSPSDALTYAPSFGISPLREAWREALYEKNPSLAGRSVSLPLVTNAITHGLSVIADMWVDPDDPVILPDKMWGNYNLIFAVRRKARISTFTFFNPRGGFNIEAFESCLEREAESAKKLIVILNFPNNPTGYTVTEAEADRIVETLQRTAQKGTRVLAVSDDAYFGLVYGKGILKESIFAKLVGKDPALLPVKVDGATKESFAWGLRVGFITYAPWVEEGPGACCDALERKTAGAVRGSISNASHLSQTIILSALRSETIRAETQEKYQILKERFQELERVLAQPRYQEVWEPYPFNSGYFMCLRLKTVDAENLRTYLLDHYGVGMIAINSTDLRVAFSCLEKADIPECFDILYRAIRELEAAAGP